jgi:hypothetical protein
MQLNWTDLFTDRVLKFQKKCKKTFNTIRLNAQLFINSCYLT